MCFVTLLSLQTTIEPYFFDILFYDLAFKKAFFVSCVCVRVFFHGVLFQTHLVKQIY